MLLFSNINCVPVALSLIATSVPLKKNGILNVYLYIGRSSVPGVQPIGFTPIELTPSDRLDVIARAVSVIDEPHSTLPSTKVSTSICPPCCLYPVTTIDPNVFMVPGLPKSLGHVCSS